jgi:hypothetical protein
MKLFDSGPRAAGASFQFTFNSAGRYRIIDRMTKANGVVVISLSLPATGKTGSPLIVT